MISANISSMPSRRKTSGASSSGRSRTPGTAATTGPRSRRCSRRRSRRRAPARRARGEQRAGEPVDLRAGVVEVVLAGDLGAVGREDAAERVADGGPPAPPMCSGPVGLAETNSRLIRRPLRTSTCPYSRTGLDDRRGQTAERPGGQGDVEEARTGNLDGADAVRVAQPGGDRLGNLARRAAGGLRQPQRDVRGVVAVLAVLGSLNHYFVGRSPGELAGCQASGHGFPNGYGEFSGVHQGNVSDPCGPIYRAAAALHRLSEQPPTLGASSPASVFSAKGRPWPSASRLPHRRRGSPRRAIARPPTRVRSAGPVPHARRRNGRVSPSSIRSSGRGG